MPLVNTKEMFEKAYKGGYAVGAFNVNNMEIVQAITEAAGELNSPVVLQVSAGARKYANSRYLIHMVKAALENYPDLPIALHLDHGSSFELCKACIDDGFSSVMIDGSALSYEENVAVTKAVCDYAHDVKARGRYITVEGELGKLAGIEDAVNVSEEDAQFTNPDEAISHKSVDKNKSHQSYENHSTFDFSITTHSIKFISSSPSFFHNHFCSFYLSTATTSQTPFYSFFLIFLVNNV